MTNKVVRCKSAHQSGRIRGKEDAEKKERKKENRFRSLYKSMEISRTYQDRFCYVYVGPRAMHCDSRPESPDRGRRRRGESRKRSPSTAPRDTNDLLGRPVPSTPECTIPSVLSHLRNKVEKKKKTWRMRKTKRRKSRCALSPYISSSFYTRVARIELSLVTAFVAFGCFIRTYTTKV